MKNTILKYSLAAFFMIAYTLPTFAWSDRSDKSDDSGYYPDNPFGGEEAPIDNWIFILAMIGTAVGIYYVSQKKYQKQID